MVDNVNYKGFGISAQSKADNGIAYNVGKNSKSLQECLSLGLDYEDVYILPKEEMLAKYVAVSGYYGKFNLNIMSNILGESAKKVFAKQIEFLYNNNLIELYNDIIKITPKGFKFYGAILSMFYPKKLIDCLV